MPRRAFRKNHCERQGHQYLTPIHKPWTPRELAMLGKFPDEIVAGRLSRSLKGVAAKRHRLVIPPSLPLYKMTRLRKKPATGS
jgi:hypothetical protein